VKDKSKAIEERRFALRLLIHCVQDMHQPLHVGDNKDKGGNLTQVRWFDRGSNMHRVWDSGIIERSGTTEEYWLDNVAHLDAPENRAACMSGTVEDWATESLLAARLAYQDPATGKQIKSGTSSATTTRRSIYRSYASGSAKPDSGYRRCSMARLQVTESR